MLLPLVGLIPFLVLFVGRGSTFAAIVVLNGVVYHGLFPESSMACWWDTGCNVCMCVAVNTMRWRTGLFGPTFVLTFVAFVAFVGILINNGQWTMDASTHPRHYVWHLLFVQIPLAVALSLPFLVQTLGGDRLESVHPKNLVNLSKKKKIVDDLVALRDRDSVNVEGHVHCKLQIANLN